MSWPGSTDWMDGARDASKLKHVRRYMETHSFWDYVDSDPAYGINFPKCACEPSIGVFEDDCSYWDHRRESAYCLATNSRRERCSMQLVPRLPFCDFHMKKALQVFISSAETEFVERAQDLAQFDADQFLSNAHITAAMVYDAQRVMSAQPERVYFYAAGQYVKVGRSLNPEQRVKSFKSGGTLCPDDVDFSAGKLLGTIPGGTTVEHQLHQEFRRHGVIGEWFHLEPVRDRISSLIAAVDDQLARTG